jgi:hypothetical protein
MAKKVGPRGGRATQGGIDPAKRISAPTNTSERPAVKSWRDVLPVHPAAELFPRMSDEELRALGEDIEKNGLRSPIALYRADPEGPAQLLDGRNRLDAIEAVMGPVVSILPYIVAEGGWLIATCQKVVEVDHTVDPYAYVISANIHRRHLTAEQRRELIEKLLKADPSKSDRQVAKQTKTSPTTVGTVRSKLEATGDVSKLDTRTDSLGRQQPAYRVPMPEAAPGVPTVNLTPEAEATPPKILTAADIRDEVLRTHGRKFVLTTLSEIVRSSRTLMLLCSGPSLITREESLSLIVEAVKAAGAAEFDRNVEQVKKTSEWLCSFFSDLEVRRTKAKRTARQAEIEKKRQGLSVVKPEGKPH